MKEFIFLLRSTPLTQDQLLAVQPKWASLVPKWAQQGHYVESYVLTNDGVQVSGVQKIITKGAIFSGEQEVLSVMIIKATDIDNALELAKECPTLESGGTVEIREILPKPVAKK